MSRVSATQKVPVRSAFGAFLSNFQSDLEWNSRGREQTLVRASQPASVTYPCLHSKTTDPAGFGNIQNEPMSHNPETQLIEIDP